MKRLQILIEEELDEALQHQACAEKTSKAALIRRYVRACLAPAAPIEEDALWAMKGADDFEPEDVDDVVYR